jgi:hypothetical protein
VDAVADQFGLTYVSNNGWDGEGRKKINSLLSALSGKNLSHITPSPSSSQATVGDPAVLATVASKAASVAAWADRHRGKRAAVRLSLFEGGGKAATTAATTTTTTTTAAAAAAAPWETWVLPLAVSPSPTNPSTSSLRCEEQQLGTSPTVSASPTTTAALPLGKGRPGLEAILLAAASAASSRRECVPPVLTPAVATFPFAIDLLPEPTAKAGGGSFGLGAVKRLLLQASPPSVLG